MGAVVTNLRLVVVAALLIPMKPLGLFIPNECNEDDGRIRTRSLRGEICFPIATVVDGLALDDDDKCCKTRWLGGAGRSAHLKGRQVMHLSACQIRNLGNTEYVCTSIPFYASICEYGTRYRYNLHCRLRFVLH